MADNLVFLLRIRSESMLYKISNEEGDFAALEPIPFKGFASFGKKEKDMENLIADNILEVLFEDQSLMPIFQERQWQEEADIYALNERGELVIFELKRSAAGDGAIHQALRYAQDAGRWSYSKLEKKFQTYSGDVVGLSEAHQEAFSLDEKLDSNKFNRKQHLIIIGNAADDSLIDAVDYWKKQGLSMEFLPYRIYSIGEQEYFEFFALPYDRHINPGISKGVIFDTNRSYDEEAIWGMMERSTIEAYGDSKRFVNHVFPGDIVFYSHKGCGVVAAAKVKRGNVKKPDDRTLSRDVEFLTSIPSKGDNIKAMPFKKVVEVTGKSFYWARTIKVPYLTRSDADIFLEELKTFLEK